MYYPNMTRFENFLKRFRSCNSDSIESTKIIPLPLQIQTHVSQKYNLGWNNNSTKVVYVDPRGHIYRNNVSNNNSAFEICWIKFWFFHVWNDCFRYYLIDSFVRINSNSNCTTVYSAIIVIQNTCVFFIVTQKSFYSISSNVFRMGAGLWIVTCRFDLRTTYGTQVRSFQFWVPFVGTVHKRASLASLNGFFRLRRTVHKSRNFA